MEQNKVILDIKEKDGEFFIELPKELGFDEDSEVEWVDNGDGTWTIKKINPVIEDQNLIIKIVNASDSKHSGVYPFATSLSIYHGLVLERLANVIATIPHSYHESHRDTLEVLVDRLRYVAELFLKGEFNDRLGLTKKHRLIEAAMDLATAALKLARATNGKF